MDSATATLRKLILDRRAYMESFFLIQDKNRQTVPLKFNKAQAEFYKKQSTRNIIVKARQLGFSTYILGYMLAEAITTPNTVCVCISHEERATQRLLSKVNLMYDNIPVAAKSIPDLYGLSSRFLRPEIHHQSAYEMTWPDIGSRFYIGTARAPAFGRGDTISMLHMSEIAYYQEGKAQELLAAVSQSVPKEGTVWIESSPRIRGDALYTIYQLAKEGIQYQPWFSPWWYADEYSLPAGDSLAIPGSEYEFTYTDEESSLVEQHSLNKDQIRWRRYKSAELEKLYGQQFSTEYPENDIDCWFVSGNSVFNIQALKAMLSRVKQPIQTDHNGMLKLWQLPKPDTKYIIGVDPASGLGADFPVAVVLDRRTNTHVATLRGKIPIDIFTEKLYNLAQKFNNARLIVERNNHGGTVLEILKRLGYPYIYSGEDDKPGFNTTIKTRPLLIDTLSSNISSMSLTTWDEQLINEAMSFEIDVTGKMQASGNSHDDILFAMMLSLIIREREPIGRPHVASTSYLPV